MASNTSTDGAPIVATVFFRMKQRTTTQDTPTKAFETLIENIQGPTPIKSRDLKPSHPGTVLEHTFTIPSTSNITLSTFRHHASVLAFEKHHTADIVLQHDLSTRRHKKLAVFDMDSTLIQQEVIDEIAALINAQDAVSAITAAAMNGELDFEASLRARCKLLQGVPASVWETLKPRITLNHGARELVTALRRLGFKTAVLSGGFMPLAGWLAGELGLDYFFANQLVVSGDGSMLTGELTGEIVHAEKKRELLKKIAGENGIRLEEVLAVGDGANDLLMLGTAGLGVAFHAKPKVQVAAPAKMNTKSLLDILYLFGLTEEEQRALLEQGEDFGGKST